MYKLVIADDEGKTTVVPLVRDEITIGRKEGNTIRLTERNISRRHARLRKANGAYLVEDLGSYNGVKVNGRRIPNEHALKAGDQITIGDYQLALQLDDGATIPETTAPLTMPNGADAATAMLASPAAPTLPAGGVGTPAVAGGPPARLVMVSQPAPGAEFALARPLTRIGRAEELDVWINHRSISREHAEIANDGGTIRIKDLGSANGVRVNGRDVQQAELKPGDTLELGQVRFRFVGPGEQFVFDAAATMQLDAATIPAPTSRAPMLVAAGIVGLAVIGAVAVAMSGGPSTPTATPIADGPQPPPVAPVIDPSAAGPAATGPSAEERVAAAVHACVTARNGGNFDLALQRAAEALAILPADTRALDCQAGAQQDREESNAFARGVALREQGDLGGAYFAFEELPPQSSFRNRPEVVQTMRDFADSTLEQAQAQLAADPGEALRLAQTVLNMTQLEPAARRAADAIARRARPRVAGGGRDRDRGPQRDPREGRDSRSGGATHATPTPRTTPTPPPTSSIPDSGQTPLVAARACLARGDNQCAVRALDGRARTTDEYALLIATYRAMGNTGRMLDTMERYIQRFPSDSRAQQYRQVLAQHGR